MNLFHLHDHFMSPLNDLLNFKNMKEKINKQDICANCGHYYFLHESNSKCECESCDSPEIPMEKKCVGFKLKIFKIKLSNYPKYIVVDMKDFNEVSKHNWILHGRDNCLIGASINGIRISIGEFIIGHKEGFVVDHVDGSIFNNQRRNLRHATNQQNLMNRSFQINNETGYKGVSWNEHARKYSAKIQINKQSIHLGYFSDPKEAAKVYNEAALKYFGEFAWLNCLE